MHFIFFLDVIIHTTYNLLVVDVLEFLMRSLTVTLQLSCIRCLLNVLLCNTVHVLVGVILLLCCFSADSFADLGLPVLRGL